MVTALSGWKSFDAQRARKKNKIPCSSCNPRDFYMPPAMSVYHYMYYYMCVRKPTQLEASCMPLHVCHCLTSDVRGELGSICKYHHLVLCRVASVGSLDMFGSQQPRFSAAEGDDVKILFRSLLEKMRDNGYMDRMRAPPKCSQDVDKFHRRH